MTTDIGLKYFSSSELKCKASGILLLSPPKGDYPGFGARIDDLREAWGKSLKVNSCCRSKVHNADIGGHTHSLHVADEPYWPTEGTCAIDFDETSDEFRQLAYSKGFSVLLENGWTHCDDRTNVVNLPQYMGKP